eukprot:TRINITY_DN159_c13_g1_i1.p1 TRINITY_DN159_c13_g1~~TRINITY_DN159_c13_g1_i1.p1  ORF type:complete len:1144 (+),score=207.08 TRINITY_DN159_c13_g1_i1:55-3432(+)
MDIKVYLTELGLPQHTETMLMNGIECVDDLEGLQRADLVGIKIPLGHANRMLKGLQEVKKQGSGGGMTKAVPKKDPLKVSVRILVVIDTTGSMNSYLLSLKETIPQLFSVFRVLFQGDAQLDLIAYKDYCDGPKLLTHCYGTESEAMIFAKALRPNGGGDNPEAVKTALNEAYTRIAESPATPTVLFHYTDAPPHHRQTKSNRDNFSAEKTRLDKQQPGFDWIKICNAFRSASVPCYTFLPKSSPPMLHNIYSCFGEVIVLPDTRPHTITKHSIGLLNQLIGEPCDFETGAKSIRLGERGLQKLSDPNTHENNSHELLGIKKEEKKGAMIKRQKQNPLLQTMVSMGFSDEFANEEALRLAEDNLQQAMEILTNKPELIKRDKITLLETQFNDHHPLASIERDVSVLPKMFKNNTEFRDLVYSVLTDLLVPSRVSSLTYNSVTGRLWRLVCSNREDSRFRPLQEALDNCIVTLGKEEVPHKRDALVQWIDESYNQLDEVIFRVTSAVEQSDSDRVTVLISNSTGVAAQKFPSRKDLRSIQCPSPGVLSQLQNFLTTLETATSHRLKLLGSLKEAVSPTFIPMNLSDSDLFASLVHLLEPGLILSLRPSCIVACVAYLSGNKHLQSRAANFLTSVKGKWIPSPEKFETYPEILSKEFGYLISKISNDFLTPAEVQLFDNISYYQRVKKTLQFRLQVSTGYRPNQERLYNDIKKTCKGCGEHRSLSLMVNADTCALCYHSVAAPEKDENKSHLVECRSCNCIYAVARIDLLKVAPKCHYCRNGKQDTRPTIECDNCKRAFIVPPGSPPLNTCGVCLANPNDGFKTQELTLLQLMTYNNSSYITSSVLGMPEEVAAEIMESRALFKLWKSQPQYQKAFIEGAFKAGCCEEMHSEQWFVDSKNTIQILNIPEVIKSIVDTVTSGSLTACCNLCFEEFSFNQLQSPCGLCDNMCCTDCLKSWYSSLKPGHLYSPTLSLCPFCKQVPKGAVLRKFNPQACCIITSKVAHKAQRATKFRSDMSYAWCVKCYKIKEAFPKACGDLAQQEITNFKCEGCQVVAKDSKSKRCPQCDVPTVKVDGCSHLTCVCGCHWCWECGESFPDVYAHLQDEHGGLMFDYDSEEEEEEQDYDPY